MVLPLLQFLHGQHFRLLPLRADGGGGGAAEELELLARLELATVVVWRPLHLQQWQVYW